MKVIIAGAGLCGLATALRLHEAGIDVTVLEGNTVAGGRVQPVLGEQQDLGPSWVWPYAQPAVSKWFEVLGIATFAQFDAGDALIDRHPDGDAQRQFLPAQHGIARVAGGTSAIIQSLLNQLPDTVRYRHAVTACAFSNSKCSVEVCVDGTTQTLHCDKLILALPPRLAAPLISAPEEVAGVINTMKKTPTWMAQHAKVVIHYDNAFWRDNELSGRVASQIGPLVEIHDHCGPDGTPAALFGFVGLTAEQRAKIGVDALCDAVRAQLLRCFGRNSPVPRAIEVKDWALEELVSSAADLAEPARHPAVVSDLVRQAWFDDRLWFAGSETAATSPGLIDGAFARADQVADQVSASIKAVSGQ